MKAPVCKVCGFIAINGDAPENCPVCHAPKSAFEEKQDAIKAPQDPSNLTELEKKHIPVITVVKKCGLIPEGCHDVHVTLGKIPHPMQPEHHILHIDFYIDKEYIARVALTPYKLNPAAALHLKQEGGILTAVALCNLHGAWSNEASI